VQPAGAEFAVDSVVQALFFEVEADAHVFLGLAGGGGFSREHAAASPGGIIISQLSP